MTASACFTVYRLLERMCVVLAATVFSGTALGALVLDQEHDTAQTAGLTVANDRTQVQTFTVGVSGRLHRIEVEVERQTMTVEDLVMSLWTTDSAGLPAALIASTSIGVGLVSSDPSFVAWDISEVVQSVFVGDVLAIVLNSNAPNTPPLFEERYHWAYGGQYDGGTAFTQFGTTYLELGEDLQFRTFVSVPEPGQTELVSIALLAILLPRLFGRGGLPGGRANADYTTPNVRHERRPRGAAFWASARWRG